MTSSLSVNKLLQSIVLMTMNTLYPTSNDLFTLVITKISINDSFALKGYDQSKRQYLHLSINVCNLLLYELKSRYNQLNFVTVIFD